MGNSRHFSLRPTFPGHASQAQYDRLSSPIWIFDVENHRIWWGNALAQELWEAESLEALVARDFSTDSAVVRTRLRQIAEHATGSEPIRGTWTIYPKGKPKTFEIALQPVWIGSGTHAFLIEAVHDVKIPIDDQAWRIMEAARTTSLLISTFSFDGMLLAQNPAATGVYGPILAEPQALSHRFKDPAVARHILSRVSENEKLSWEVEVRAASGDRTHLITAQRGRDPITGDIIVVLSEENVTELAALRKLQANLNKTLQGTIAERTDRLRVVEESFALAMQTALIWDWDIETDALFVSPGFIEALGYEKAEFDRIVARDKVFGFVADEDAKQMRTALTRHLKAPDTPLAIETRFRTRSGVYKWFQMQGHSITNAQGQTTRSVGVVTDITERKVLEASLMVSQRLEAIGQLTGGLAHDFNNLLTVIQGNAELLNETTDTDPEITSDIIEAARRGAELTHHLLSFARKQTLIPRDVDLGNLVDQMSKTLFRTLGGSIAITVQVPDDLWSVYADTSQIEAALLNTALNARDAMPSGGKLKIACRNITMTAAVAQNEHLALTPRDYVEISVTDTGTGMSGEVISKAFEPFFTTKDVGKGSGLGLSMVHGFCRQSGGDAKITSIAGKGTSVFLYLPRSEGDTLSLDHEERDMPDRGTGEHVHILEDSPQVQKTLVRMVEGLGYRVTTSSDAREALEVATRTPHPDLVLADIILPGGHSGVDFAEMLQQKQPDARIILMSGYPNFEQDRMKTKGLHWPMLSKPLDRQALAKAFRAALAEEPNTQPRAQDRSRQQEKWP